MGFDVDPQGVSVKAFGLLTREELSHDFLWRIRAALPRPGIIGIFDRSQYEDVLIVRVRDLVPRSVWSRRYATINCFESRLVDRGVRVIKVFLHISLEGATRTTARPPGRSDEALEVQSARSR